VNEQMCRVAHKGVIKTVDFLSLYKIKSAETTVLKETILIWWLLK